MLPGQIRAIAICILRRHESILVFEGHDTTKGQTFYRPLGGAIEFGEIGSQAAIREIREEIHAEITNLRPIGTLENIFTFEGRPGHEIVLVYEADFADATLYQETPIIGQEDSGERFPVLWKPLADFAGGQSPLYPDGLLELLLNK